MQTTGKIITQADIDRVSYDPNARGARWIGADGKRYSSSSQAAASFARQRLAK